METGEGFEAFEVDPLPLRGEIVAAPCLTSSFVPIQIAINEAEWRHWYELEAPENGRIPDGYDDVGVKKEIIAKVVWEVWILILVSGGFLDSFLLCLALGSFQAYVAGTILAGGSNHPECRQIRSVYLCVLVVVPWYLEFPF